jgi:hypothetical protein
MLVSSIFAAVGLAALAGVSEAPHVVYFGTDPGATSLGVGDEFRVFDERVTRLLRGSAILL